MMVKGYILERITNRLLKLNKNFLAVVTGDTGSGKSYAAMRLAQLIDPKFSVKNIALDPEQFFEILENKNVGKGSCIIFDEAGVGMGARDWYTIQNKVFGYVLQTFRHLNIAVIFTVPNLSFIDVQLRNLLHMHLNMQSINYNTLVSRAKVYYLKQRPREDKYIPIHPRVRIPGKYTSVGKISKCDIWEFKIPPDHMIMSYEAKKDKFSSALREDAHETLKRIKEKAKPKVTKSDVARELIKKGMRTRDIVKVSGLNAPRISQLRNEI